ncbi:serine/threonine protein kinase, partial [Enhygromyxa salina]|uniref:serine/threonine protein kinase n=1 Tax=Enhygromyxa salina TaxID=215803 RepID=UPI000D096625
MTAELPQIGETLAGRYELLDTLGEGGMSVVFRARDRQTRSEVALKLLTPRYLGRPEREQRLLDEAQYLEWLRGTPGIIELIDHGRLADRHDWPFLVTKLLRGRALNWQLITHKFTPGEIRELALGIARALASCHAAGVIHRDLTPTNVSVVLNPLAVELFDFSHAASVDAPRVAPGDSGRLTGVFDVPGTSGYMGPEQASSAPADAKMDVFSFGVLLYEIITGRNPYPNVSHKEFIELQRAGNLEPPRLQAWVYDVDPSWGELIRECTLADPRGRPSSAALVKTIEALDAVAPGPGQPSEEDPTNVLVRAPTAVAPSPGQPSEEDPTKVLVWAPPPELAGEEDRTYRIELPNDEDRTNRIEPGLPGDDDRTNQLVRPRVVSPPQQPPEEDRTHQLARAEIEGLQAQTRRAPEAASAEAIGAWGPPPGGALTPSPTPAPPTPSPTPTPTPTPPVEVPPTPPSPAVPAVEAPTPSAP